MTTGLVILIYLLDALVPSLGPDLPQHPWAYAGWLFGVVFFVGTAFEFLRRRLDRTGRTRNIVRAERLLSLGRAMIVGLHAYAIVELGWSRTAERLTGNLPVVREFVTALPPLLAFVALYWSYAPIQRRIREALLWRHLHESVPIIPDRSRCALVWEHVRHSILLGLVPLLMLSAWHHFGDFATSFTRARSAGWGEWALILWQVAGVFIVLAVSPWVLRFVWDTVPLKGGALRESVESVFSRNRVSAREVLVWQTSSGILNGALMGIIPRARYVLFTDALLQLLPLRQVEAVAAHEAGHGRLRHLPWLLGSTIVAALFGAVILAVMLEFLKLPESWWLSVVGILATAGPGVLMLGFVSRRFELQADAFAAKDLSRFQPAPEGGVPPPASHEITHESAASMIDALETVSRLNGIPPERFTWRHGTVEGRQAHLASIVGLPLDKLPIDRVVSRLKTVTLAAAAIVVLALVASVLFLPSGDTLRHGPESERTPAVRHDSRLEHETARRPSHARESSDRRYLGARDG
ncbi:MAG: M48 family metalloprotease [Phycisphaeraceae bacterium]|nr:M48 family metalloprotease [Phycisphaeraceae bacterium]